MFCFHQLHLKTRESIGHRVHIHRYVWQLWDIVNQIEQVSHVGKKLLTPGFELDSCCSIFIFLYSVLLIIICLFVCFYFGHCSFCSCSIYGLWFSNLYYISIIRCQTLQEDQKLWWFMCWCIHKNIVLRLLFVFHFILLGLAPLSTIFQLYRGGHFFLVKETGVPGENHRPVASHWQTLSHNFVSSTPCLSGVWTHNVSGDNHWLHMSL